MVAAVSQSGVIKGPGVLTDPERLAADLEDE